MVEKIKKWDWTEMHVITTSQTPTTYVSKHRSGLMKMSGKTLGRDGGCLFEWLPTA